MIGVSIDGKISTRHRTTREKNEKFEDSSADVRK
jgi:hypothetical protein